MLTAATFLSLAMQCAPLVHPDTISDIAKTESGFNPYAIAEIVPLKNGGNRVVSHYPSSKEEGLKIVEEIKKKNHRYSVGVMQITNTNFPVYNVNADTMFNPCDNLRIAEKIIIDCYERGGTLKRALSCFYTGNFESGQKPESDFSGTSYIQRIGYVVPSTKQDRASESLKVHDPELTSYAIYPDRVVRGLLPEAINDKQTTINYPSHVVRGELAISVKKE